MPESGYQRVSRSLLPRKTGTERRAGRGVEGRCLLGTTYVSVCFHLVGTSGTAEAAHHVLDGKGRRDGPVGGTVAELTLCT